MNTAVDAPTEVQGPPATKVRRLDQMGDPVITCPECGTDGYGALDLAHPDDDPFQNGTCLVGTCLYCGYVNEDWYGSLETAEAWACHIPLGHPARPTGKRRPQPLPHNRGLVGRTVLVPSMRRRRRLRLVVDEVVVLGHGNAIVRGRMARRAGVAAARAQHTVTTIVHSGDRIVESR